MAKKTPGLYRRNGLWHIDKQIKGYGRVCESTGERSLEQAERYLALRLEGIRHVSVHGIRPTRTFVEAATKYLEENRANRAIQREADGLNEVLKYVAPQTPLEQIHDGTFDSFRSARRNAGRAAGTINRDLAPVRRMLKLAASVWRDESGPWLSAMAVIRTVKGEKRKPYPLTWEEQRRLFQQLPGHLQRMALFKVNTGCREREVVELRWDWEVRVPELDTSVFILPEWLTKNGEERIVVLNSTARKVIDEARGHHSERVFTYDGQPVTRIYNSAWKKARARAKLEQARVHDLRHTFGQRLRAAGVPLEDRKALLGHKCGDVTTHYSAPELAKVIEYVERICVERPNTVLRLASPAKVPQRAPQNAKVSKGLLRY
ncbi:MAG: site-specific integrase [Gammaproteobacteria bacterium]